MVPLEPQTTSRTGISEEKQPTPDIPTVEMTALIALLHSSLSFSLLQKCIVAVRNLTVSQRQGKLFVCLRSSTAFAGKKMQASCWVMDVIQLSPGTNNSGGEGAVRTPARSRSVAPTEGLLVVKGLWIKWTSVYGRKILLKF